MTYEASQVFNVPKGINLEDSDQVKEHWIKWDCLYIELNKGHMEEWVDKYYKEDDRYVNIKDGIIGARQKQIVDRLEDWERPCETHIENAKDYEEFEEEEEEEEEFDRCISCECEFNRRKIIKDADMLYMWKIFEEQKLLHGLCHECFMKSLKFT